MNEKPEQGVFNYIEELVNTLKICVQILARFKQLVDKPQEWQEMLNTFHETIQAAEKTIEERTLN